MSVGLGLGLFGVLSIIRLRSSELDQEEIAYYFVALALGLLGGIEVSDAWVNPALMAVVLAVMYVGDHPNLFGGYRSQTITLDRAFTSEPELLERLGELLGARVHRVTVRRVDLVNDTTLVEARFRLGRSGRCSSTDSSASCRPSTVPSSSVWPVSWTAVIAST